MVRVERAEIFDVLKLQCFSPLVPYFYIFFKLPYHFHQMLKSRYGEGLINNFPWKTVNSSLMDIGYSVILRNDVDFSYSIDFLWENLGSLL